MQEATAFAHSITLDHMILETQEESAREGERVACALFDIATKWTDSIPAKTKVADDTGKAVNQFLGPQIKPS